jgi:L-alanine-DL-glutamate epimerase-like enolase superfamily enzyme
VSDPRIVRIELTPLHVPFRELVRQAMAASAGGLGMAIPAEDPWTGGDFAICRLTAEDGSSGVGESFVWLPESGVSPTQLIDTIRGALATYVLGESPFAVEKIRHRMDCNVARCEMAKGLLDMACYDLMGHVAGRPACDFMGGRCVDELPLTALIPLTDVDAMVEMALAFEREGARSFRLKLGESIAGDVHIVSRTREALGDRARLRVDYNQAYTPAEAVRAIRALEPYGIEVAEQPVRATDPLGMARVQRQVATPLLAHEGCFSLLDLIQLIELEAVGVVGINSERPGGVTNALRAITYAEQRGLGVVLHNQPLGIASAMQVHLAAARFPALGHAIELFGHVMLEDDLIVEPLDYAGGTVSVPEGPGFGVELDRGALERYATAATSVIEL